MVIDLRKTISGTSSVNCQESTLTIRQKIIIIVRVFITLISYYYTWFWLHVRFFLLSLLFSIQIVVDLTHDKLHYFLDVDVFLGGCLKILNSMFVSYFKCLTFKDSTLLLTVCEVDLISHENLRECGIGSSAIYRVDPRAHILEGLLLG